MPSDQSTWLISIPQDGDSEGISQELHSKLVNNSKNAPSLSPLSIPSFKTGTLASLISLSEDIPKQDTSFTATMAKIVDTLRNLLNNDSSKLAQHVLVNEQPVDEYLLNEWRWNEGRYNIQRGLREIFDVLIKEMTSIDNVMKSKLSSYNLAKGQLVQLQRKKTGNLSIRSLADVVKPEHVIQDSEYLSSELVAVPKRLVKEWNTKYERLTNMVVPRSAQVIASDDDYTLYVVVVFKRVRDEFVQKCRENKYIVRDFIYSGEALEKEREELEAADTMEKELWTELLRLSRTNFSEAFQILVHLKVLHLFAESVLRYGLPANYTGFLVKPDSKTAKRTLAILQQQFAYLSSRDPTTKAAKSKGDLNVEDFAGEYQTILDQEYYPFVIFEVPWIVL